MRTLIATLLFVCLAPCPAQTPWQPDRFPISCWRGPPPSHNTLQDYKVLKECHFNLVGPTGDYTPEENRKLLDLCARVGLRAILVDSRLSTQMTLWDNWRELVADVIGDYAQHPALYGYYLQDEPSSLLFGPLGLISQEFERRDPNHLPYINLLPTYANTRQLGTPSYKDYLARFCDIAKPRLLSYDHYALLPKGGTRPDYYENMELVRAESLRRGIPWWYVHSSGAYAGYRRPTDAELRLQLYSSLAYGAKGVSYWYYWGRKQENDERTGVVDPDGHPTPLYDMLRRLNRETQIIGDILLPAKSLAVAHVGTIPPGARRLGGDAPLHLPEDSPLLAGFFRGPKSYEYALLVNRNVDDRIFFNVRFSPRVKHVESISCRNGTARLLPLDEHALDLGLDPGNGLLLRLTIEFHYPHPPKKLSTIDFEFNTDGDKEGWEGQTATKGVLRLPLRPQDPYFRREYLRIPADTYVALRVRMRVSSGDPMAQVFWTTSDEPAFSDTKFMDFPIQPDGEWHEYDIPVGKHERWRGKEIRGLRLDPTVGGSAPEAFAEIDWIRGVPASP